MTTAHLRKMHAAAARARKEAARETWRAALRETRPANPRCKCPIPSSPADLSGLGGGCTMPAYCCPRLDAVRRRAGQ